MDAPDKGDIVWFSFDPSTGKEIMKRRPAFVISRRAFNEHTGFAIVAPITSTVRGMKLEVVLPDDLATKGAVLVHQIKSLDFENRQVVLIEKAPEPVIEKVTELAMTIIQ
jgi:mRNA-degrading endonuclease toxin of MazEF toxin-antitoxin module